jgi:hypothetical protein
MNRIMVILTPIETESLQVFLKARSQSSASLSQSNFASKLDMTHRTRRLRVNAVAIRVP